MTKDLPNKNIDTASLVDKFEFVTSKYWSKQEEEQFFKAVRTHGNDMYAVADDMKVKTKEQC